MLHFGCFCVKLLNLITHKNGKNLIAFFFFRVKERFSEVPAGGRLQLVLFYFFKQDQGQSKESTKPRLIYSKKAIASARLEISWKNFYTSYVHIYIFTILFYHSLDNDRSTVETSCFTVSFYR